MQVDDPAVGENLGELSRAFAGSDDPELIEAFLRSLLTPSEIADVAARWALVKALDAKVPQREIARELGLSLCKITRGSRELKKPDSPFRHMLVLATVPRGD
ncbi:MAG TPA: transcriptional regulator [Treponema sp.]|nr:MAG: transcriptional regulator [Treponema sp. GWC1_61_84]HCM26657.1 transcriptional regulator [Treponema sp.]